MGKRLELIQIAKKLVSKAGEKTEQGEESKDGMHWTVVDCKFDLDEVLHARAMTEDLKVDHVLTI